MPRSLYQQIHLQNLLEQLRLQGIAIGTIELRHLQHIFQTQPLLSRTELSDLLCTVLANTADQRHTVQRIFQQYIPYDHERPKNRKSEISVSNKPKKNKQKRNDNENTESKIIATITKLKKAFNIWFLGLVSLFIFVLTGVFFAQSGDSTSIATPTPRLITDIVVQPPTTEKTALNTVKKITWTYEITHSETITQQQRLFAPLILLFGSGLALFWLGYRAWRRICKPSSKPVYIAAKGTLQTPAMETSTDFYLLDARQRYKISGGVNHYMSDQILPQLDISKTVQQSACHAMPRIHFKTRSEQRQVWIWIDQASQNNDLLRLKDEIIQTLAAMKVDVQCGYFHSLPQRVNDAQGRLIWASTQAPPEHQPLVLLFMDAENLNLAYPRQADKEAHSLTQLSKWSTLTLVDYSQHINSLQGIARDYGLPCILPPQVASWLAQQGSLQKQAKPLECNLGELSRWATACALPSHALKEAEIRELHNTLGLDCAWQYSKLQHYATPTATGFDFSAWRVTLLKDIRQQDLITAKRFWRQRYQQIDKRNQQQSTSKHAWSNSRRQKFLHIRLLLLALWSTKRKTIEKTCAELYTLQQNPQLRGEVVRQLAQYRCEGMADENSELIQLPFTWQKLPNLTQRRLLNMSFAGKTQRSTLQWDKTTASVLGILAGLVIASSLWNLYALIPQPAQLKSRLDSALPPELANRLDAIKNRLIATQQWHNNQISWLTWQKHIQFKQVEHNKTIKLPNQLTLLALEKGELIMGDDDSQYEDERPAHSVKINPFWMSKTEITFNQYDTYSKAKALDTVDDEGWGRDNRPVINVSWDDTQAYLKWLNQAYTKQLAGLECRLPSEAEWEYAARAGTKTAYYWGDTASHDYANYREKEGKGQWENTAPVGSFLPNTWGLHDMSGNVWEWVEDKWHSNYQGAPSDGSAWLEGDIKRRVLRGGSWDLTSDDVRSAVRIDYDPGSRDDDVGFRIVCVPIR